MNWWMDIWIDCCIGWMYGWLNGWMDGWMDKRVSRGRKSLWTKSDAQRRVCVDLRESKADDAIIASFHIDRSKVIRRRRSYSNTCGLWLFLWWLLLIVCLKGTDRHFSDSFIDEVNISSKMRPTKNEASAAAITMVMTAIAVGYGDISRSSTG